MSLVINWKKFRPKKKEDYIPIVFGLILMGIVFLISYFALSQSRPEPQSIAPTPTLIPTSTVSQSGTEPQVRFDKEAQQRLLEKVNKRPPLSVADKAAKEKILSKLPAGKLSGILYETTNTNIEYVSSADLFMVEIKTIDVAQAKADANVWFRSQGISQKGICDLPVMFYLNAQVLENIHNINIQFSPVGTGC